MKVRAGIPVPPQTAPDPIAAVEQMLGHAARGPILCVGDLMLDRFVVGRVERISPEAPIPVLAIEHESTMPGGAGNVVANIRALGGKAHIVAVVGTDAEGLFLQDLLGPADLSFVIDPARPTSVKTRFIANGQQLFRADMELSRPISPKIEEQVVDEVQKRLRTASMLILSDYGKGVLTDRVIARAIAGAKAQGIWPLSRRHRDHPELPGSVRRCRRDRPGQRQAGRGRARRAR